MPQKRVAIIGAGPAGLVAAKEVLERGLIPVVFEKHAEIGGLWNPATGSTWPGLRTNISKATNLFPDFEWPENISDFPSQKDMYEYLHAYAEKYNLKNYIKLNTPVRLVQQQDNRWIVSTDSNVECFDFVVIASGIFSKPYIPFEQSAIRAIHSSEYKDSKIVADKDVIVFGSGFSGVDIAAEVASTARSVTHLIRTPHWIVPRYINGKPLDKVFYEQPNRVNPHEVLFKTDQENIKTNAYMATLSPMQATSLAGDLYIESVNNSVPPKVAISEQYINLVKTGKIVVKKGTLDNYIRGNNNQLIIYCTGYKLDLNFLHKDILNALEYKDDQLQPILLYKCTWSPKLPGMAFVGMYRGPYLPIMELQAKWAAKIFSGELKLPSQQLISEAIVMERKIRDLPKSQRPQFPHGDYVGLKNDLNLEITRGANILYGYNFSSRNNRLIALGLGLAAVGLGVAVHKYANKF